MDGGSGGGGGKALVLTAIFDFKNLASPTLKIILPPMPYIIW